MPRSSVTAISNRLGLFQKKERQTRHPSHHGKSILPTKRVWSAIEMGMEIWVVKKEKKDVGSDNITISTEICLS